MITNIEQKVKFLDKIVNNNHSDVSTTQLTLVKSLSRNSIHGLDILLLFLVTRKLQERWKANHIDGLIYEILLQQSSAKFNSVLIRIFSHGIVLLKSQKNIDYLPLQKLLVRKQFYEANILTHNTLRKLSSLHKNDRSWLYFTDVLSLPSVDLHTIDNLWKTHSFNKFGFSIQRKIWLASGKDWNKLWNKIGWQFNHVLCRYPYEFQWDINGPKGHLPLFNQLYGVQPMLALFEHEAWKY